MGKGVVPVNKAYQSRPPVVPIYNVRARPRSSASALGAPARAKTALTPKSLNTAAETWPFAYL